MRKLFIRNSDNWVRRSEAKSIPNYIKAFHSNSDSWVRRSEAKSISQKSQEIT